MLRGIRALERDERRGSQRGCLASERFAFAARGIEDWSRGNALRRRRAMR